jgi:hypothetical protein
VACLFLETRNRFQKGQNSGKRVWSSSPGEGDPCSSGTKNDTKAAPRPKFLLLQEDYSNKDYEPENLSSVRVPTKMISLDRNVGTKE